MFDVGRANFENKKQWSGEMKGIIGGVILIFVGVSGWFVGSRLSADAIGMAVGIFFGIMAGVPVAIMVLASRRQADQYYNQHPHNQHPYNQNRGAHGRGKNPQMPYGNQLPYAPQPPVIVVTGNGAPQQTAYPMNGYPQMNALPPAGERYFDMGPTPAQQAMQQPAPQHHTPQHHTPQHPAARQFRVVGEQDEQIDGW